MRVRFEELLAETRSALRDGDVPAAADAVASALALWRGPALQGLTGTAWFSAEARRLETLHVDALEEDFEVRLALGEHRELTPALRSALADNPFRERLWGQLMLALYRSGRQADALETFQEARRVLADELGLEPGPELRRLQEAILAHDPAIAAVPVDPQAPRQSPRAIDVVRRPRGRARPGRRPAARAPPRDAHRASGCGEESARGRDGALARARVPGRHLARRLRARGRRGRRCPAPRTRRRRSRLRPARTRDVAASRDADALVVLDACEHVLEEAARIASTLLAECPQVRILATSREALHVAGEVRIPVAPLGSAAVELFLERARAARPGFEPDAEAVALAAEIARRVDGLPLAIELAAARVNVLGLAELVSILERRAALLRDSPASDPSRTALQELVEWSYDLLHGDEKTLLQQLAVHRGGASLASLAAVAATHGLNEATVAYLVSALVDKSIVSASFAGGVARYDMLDTVREYVLERLAESGGLAAARGAHAEYFAALAEEARVELRGPEWLRWERRLELENDNLWAALAYARDAPDPAVAIRLGTLGWYFALAERVSEGRRFLELALSATGDDAPVELRIELLAVLCYLATEELDLDARARGGRARALARRDRGGAEAAGARATDARARPRAVRGRGRADAMAQDACATLEAAGDDWGVAASSLIRATGAAHAGDVATVAAMAATVRRHSDAIEYDAFRVPGLLLEAWVAERRQDGTAAVEAYRRALELAGRVGVRRPRGVRPRRTRGERARERRSARGRGAPAAGACSPPRRPRRRGSRPMHASSSGASLPRPGMPTAPRGCTARSSSGRRRSGRTRRARASSSRSPAARPRRRCSGLRSSPRAAATPLRRTSSAAARASRSPELAEPPPRLAERWQRRPRAFRAVREQTNRRLDMSTTTIEDQLAEIRRRIDRLRAHAQAGAPRIRRHLDALHQAEAAVRAALRPRLPTRSRRSSGS